MNLLGRVVVEKRAVLVPIAVAIVANVAAYGILVHPLQERVSTGETRALAAARAQRQAEQDLAGVRATQAGKQTAEVQLQKFYHQVLPGTLGDARHAIYLRLAQMAAESNLRYLRQTAEEVPGKDSPLTRLQVVLTLEGSYQDIFRFIHTVETAPEFLIIDNVALAVRNEPNAPLVLTLAVSTYFWTRGNAI